MSKYHNYESYSDPTAGMAISEVAHEERKKKREKKLKMEYERFKNLLEHINILCEEHGFTIENRVWLKDERTGKVWK